MSPPGPRAVTASRAATGYRSRVRRAQPFVLVAAVLCASRAGAPPPLSQFPSALRPDDGATAPPNARIWAFGADAPAVAQVGFAVSVDGAPIDVVTVSMGCCVVVATPATPLVVGDVVSVLVTSAGAEATAAFTVAGVADDVAPTLSTPVVIDAAGGSLILGVAGDDDVDLAGFLARHGDVVVSAATDDVVLEAPVDGLGCVDVVAVDLAGNESPPQTACAPDDDADAGPTPDPEPPPSCGASAVAPYADAAPRAGAATLGVLALLLARRRRRSQRISRAGTGSSSSSSSKAPTAPPSPPSRSM